MNTSRREFLVTGAASLALSAAIFRSVQGWLGEGRQYMGGGLKRPLDRPLTPSASAGRGARTEPMSMPLPLKISFITAYRLPFALHIK